MIENTRELLILLFEDLETLGREWRELVCNFKFKDKHKSE